MNKRDLKAYVRMDGKGRVVPGSLILRKSKPKTGTWVEAQGYKCCNDITLSTIVEDVDMVFMGIKLLCNETIIGTYNTETATASPEDVVNVLNAKYGMLGVFDFVPDADPSQITLTMNASQKKALCPSGTLSFQIVELQ